MGDEIYIKADPDIKDLLPGYLENRRKDIELIKKALEAEDWQEIKTIGHRMKGSGASYGFVDISQLGKAIEEAAHNQDKEKIKDATRELEKYLSRVRIAD